MAGIDMDKMSRFSLDIFLYTDSVKKVGITVKKAVHEFDKNGLL